MSKIFTAKQVKEWDAYTIQHEPIASIDLMERACKTFVTWFTEHFDAVRRVGVVCGTGNNGGDGLGIARMLQELGYGVKIWIVRAIVPESNDFAINRARLSDKIEVSDIVSETDENIFSDCEVLIDAVFGSGLSRPLQGLYARVVECMNHADVIRVAVDTPSGLMVEAHSEEPVVQAHYTVTFQSPKLAFLLPENNRYVGEWCVVDIGLHREFVRNTTTPFKLLQKKHIKKIMNPRSRFDHKGNYGHALLIAGSYGKMGAALLAAKAALRSGVGLLTVHIPRKGYSIIQASVPEAMVDVDSHEEVFTNFLNLEGYTAIGVGPGLGKHRETHTAVGQLLQRSSKPLVIDADALNIIAENREYLHLLPEESILTPHPKEFQRLAGPSTNDFNRLERLRSFAADTKCIVMLKGAYTAVAFPDGQVHFNSTGNPGMATGGTGDVLTGILTGLLAQGYTPRQAALFGVFLHGLSGDLAMHEKSMEALIASDLTDFLARAYRQISY